MGEHLEGALGYAALGWRVHPCRPGRKEPLTRWRDEATTDPVTITAWWRRWPHANVAVCTGAPGPDVLDVDVKNGAAGMALFERVRRAGLLRGAAGIIHTPSGGLHLWFNGSAQTGGAVGPLRDLELKATGGYVLVPPSGTGAGRYELAERRDTGGWLDWQAVRRLLDPPPARPVGSRRAAANGAALADWLSRQCEGNRNSALFWACCRALESGQEDLSDLEHAAITLGLSAVEARRTAESARRKVRGRA